MVISSETADEVDYAKELENLKLIEAVLFVSAKFLSMAELVTLTDLNPIIIKHLVEKLQEKYERSDSAIEVIEKNEMYKMDVRSEYSNIITKLATGKSEFSKAEQETLAIVAYKQPIKQSVVIKIRGNKAYEHIKKFSDLNLVKSKKVGHTHELSLSDDFYEYFNLEEKGEGSEEERGD